MKTTTNSFYRTKPEFSLLIQKCTDEQHTALEAEMIELGRCPRPVTVWKEENILLCDSTVCDLCTSWEVEPDIDLQSFKTEQDAMAYICESELKRKDLSEERWKYLIGKMYLLAIKPDSYYSVTHLQKEDVQKNSKIQTAISIANEYGISHATVAKYSWYAAAMDTIIKADPEIASLLLDGTIFVSQHVTIELSRLPLDQIHSLRDFFHTNTKRIDMNAIRHELSWKKLVSKASQNVNRDTQEMAIQQMPEYDPDSAVMTLILTIPSWIGSMKRISAYSSLSEISENARNSLYYQLEMVKNTAYDLQNLIQDQKNGGKTYAGNES